jgi:SM-20-related protein
MNTLDARVWPRRERLHERIVTLVAEHGWCVIEQFIDTELSLDLHSACMADTEAGLLLPAGVGHGVAHRRDTAVRGDCTRWLDRQSGRACERRLLDAFDALRAAFNAEAFLNLVELEAHYAYYAPGTHYGVHRDRFRDDDRRALSLVLYLNPAWQAREGGALRLYLDEARTTYEDVLPQAGRLLVFRAERYDHEVLTTARARYSVAAWLRRR